MTVARKISPTITQRKREGSASVFTFTKCLTEIGMKLRAIVALCNLPYRRFVIGKPAENDRLYCPQLLAECNSAILRLQLCATIPVSPDAFNRIPHSVFRRKPVLLYPASKSAWSTRRPPRPFPR